MKILSSKNIIIAALIAAIYADLSMPFAQICYGPIQFRISEALTVLPIFTPAAIPGLFLGCIVTNIYGVCNNINPASPLDIVFGSLATLIAAILTYYIAKKSKSKIAKYILSPLPVVLINAIVIGIEIGIMQNINIFANILYIGLSELIICYILGVPLIFALYKNDLHKKIF